MPGRRYQSRIDLLQGTLDFIILQTLRWGTQHGYGISHAINANSQDAFKVETGSLYPALHRLEKQGWVASEWKLSEKGQRAKYYKLTAAGRRQLATEQSRWDRLVDAMRSIMQPFDPAEDRAPR
jgi:PadR family transcriptional regulator, regulatory protein PadR